MGRQQSKRAVSRCETGGEARIRPCRRHGWCSRPSGCRGCFTSNAVAPKFEGGNSWTNLLKQMVDVGNNDDTECSELTQEMEIPSTIKEKRNCRAASLPELFQVMLSVPLIFGPTAAAPRDTYSACTMETQLTLRMLQRWPCTVQIMLEVKTERYGVMAVFRAYLEADEDQCPLETSD